MATTYESNNKRVERGKEDNPIQIFMDGSRLKEE